MTERFHGNYAAYCIAPPKIDEARLFSLKIECIPLANVVARYVDAVLLHDNAIVPVPFILIADDGEIVLHEYHRRLHVRVRDWLRKAIADWLATKPAEAHLVADIFEKESPLHREVLSAASDSSSAFLGMAAYDTIFTEAERYANLSPFVAKRSVADFNPGLGYGIRTLGQVASRIAARYDRGSGAARRIAPKLDTGTKEAQVGVWLDVPPEALDRVLEEMRASLPADCVTIVSARGDAGKEALCTAGADVLKMSRPGAEGLGALDEWLGVFGTEVPAVAASQNASPVAVQVSPRPLRVLFALRPSAKTIFGGDVVQVRETAEALRRRGHFVEVSMEPELDASGFDVVHLTNLTVPPETLPQAKSVAEFQGAVVMMPIFTDHCDETVWGMSVCTSVYATVQDSEAFKARLDAIAQRTIAVRDILPPPNRPEMIENYTAMQRETLQCVDLLIANAHSEMNRLFRYVDCEVPYTVAPSCANPGIYGVHARERFVRRYGLEDFVLLAGRYESRKNQFGFFQAMEGLEYPVLFVGNNYDAVVGKVVRMHRIPRAAYIAHLPEEDLAGAFAAARVVAIPSWDEVVSLTSLNAAISEASMVLTRNSYEHEYFADDAEYCDPASIHSIRAAVRRAWSTHEARAERRRELARRVLRDYNWDRSAAMTEVAYYRVLSFNPRRDVRTVHCPRQVVR